MTAYEFGRLRFMYRHELRNRAELWAYGCLQAAAGKGPSMEERIAGAEDYHRALWRRDAQRVTRIRFDLPLRKEHLLPLLPSIYL